MPDQWDQFKDAKPDEYAGFEDYDMTGPDDRAPRPKKKSFSLGFGEEVGKVVANINRVNPLNVLDNIGDLGASRKRGLQKMQDYFAKREQKEIPATSGKIAGDIVAMLPAIYATKNPFIAGGLQGAALTDARDPAGVAADAGFGAVTNWFGGKVADKVADVIAPVIEPAVRRLADAGVKMSPGMIRGGKAGIREERRMSKPVVGDAIAEARRGAHTTFNTAAVNKALEPLGFKVPSVIQPGHDAIAYAKTQIRREYDLVVPNLAVRLDGKAFATNLGPKVEALPPTQRKEFMRLISLHLKDGNLSGQAIKDAQEALRTEASEYATGGPVERKMARAFTAADDELTDAMLAQNPQWAPRLSRVNAAYKGYRIVADGASRADEGIQGTGQLRQAVRRADRTKSKDATARGEAFMQQFSEDARKVLPAKVPDSGTAGRLNDGNLFARLGGTADAAKFRAEQALAKISLLPRPQQAEALAKLLRQLRAPAGAGAVATLEQSNN